MMESISPKQLGELREYLENKGLAYDSLQTEMLDHICCDVENHMEQGLSFDESLEKIKSEIPKDQLKKIQTETMTAIQKESKLPTVFMYASFFMLLLATVFKMLKFPGTGQLLISSFIVLAITLVSSIFTNPLIRENKTGRWAAIAVLVSVLIFICSLCFQMLHLPGGQFLREISVVSLIVMLGIYAGYFFLYPEKASDHFIINHMKRYGAGIEKSLLVLFAIGLSLKMWNNDFVSVIYYMMLFSFGSIFYLVNSWQFYLSKQEQKSHRLAFLVVSIVVFSAFLSPTMTRILEEPVRIIMIWGAFTLASLAVSIFYFVQSDEKQRWVLGFFSLLVSVLCLINLVAKSMLGGTALAGHFLNLVYHPVILGSLMVVFLVFFKKPVFRALLLMALAMMTFTYQYPGI